MNEFQLKNYLKFIFKYIKENEFRMTCTGDNLTYNIIVTEEGIKVQSGDTLYLSQDIDKLIFAEPRFKITKIEMYKYSDSNLIDKHIIPNPDKMRIYYTLFSLMGKKAGLILVDRFGNCYRGCYTSGKVLYIEDLKDSVKFNITELQSLRLEILCITDIPGYTTFKSYVAEAEKYAKCTNREFIKYGKREQNYA